MRWQETPVFINNRDNLDRGFRGLVGWLREIGMTQIIILDNGSTYPPLLDYYDRAGLNVLWLHENLGPLALWSCSCAPAKPFIVTDPDVVPADTCPADLIPKMYEVFARYPKAFKVGPSLRVDNLPASYARRDEVIKWEQQFWGDSRGDCYPAGIDTTFALYGPGSGPGSSSWHADAEHLRLAPPYTFEHVPWYEDSAHPSEEAQYYRQHADAKWRHW